MSRSLWSFACLTVATLLLPAASSSTISRHNPQSVLTKTLPRFTECPLLRPQVRPKSILMACGDGAFLLTDLKWSTWTSSGANGTGIGRTRCCTRSGSFLPNMRMTANPVAIRLFRPVRCSMPAGLQFTRITWRYTRSKPPIMVRGDTRKGTYSDAGNCRGGEVGTYPQPG